MTDATAQIHADPDATVQPHPPRYWWLKRIAIVSAVLVALVAGLRLWWGYEAEHRLNALVAQYRAAGEPIEPEDFNPPPIPDEQNAAVYWKQAGETLSLSADLPRKFMDGERADIGVLGSHRAFIRYFSADIAALLEKNADCLSLIAQAAALPDDVPLEPIKSPVIHLLLPSLQNSRTLAKFLRVAALHEHEAGRDRVCLAHVNAMLSLGESADGFPTVINHLVAVACDALATEVVERAAPNLRIVSDSDADDQSAATRQQVRALIDRLLDEVAFRHGMVWAFFGERAMHLDNGRMLQNGQVIWQDFMYVGGGVASSSDRWLSIIGSRIGYPILATDVAYTMDIMTAMVEAAEIRGYHDAVQHMPTPAIPTSGIRSFAHLYARTMLPSLRRAFELHFRELVFRQMAAVALAIRLYEIDHGRRPPTLDALVPNYLPAVPVDLYDPDLGPIRYLPDAKEPLLYSVGSDGVDDNGEYVPSPYRGVDMEVADFVFFLDGDRPVSEDREKLVASLNESQGDQEGARDERGDADEDENADQQP